MDPTRVGVVIGSAFGGMDSFEKAVNDLSQFGPSAVGPYTIPMILGLRPLPPSILRQTIQKHDSTHCISNASALIISTTGDIIYSVHHAYIHMLYLRDNTIYPPALISGNTAAGVVAMETGAKGPNMGTQTACATATHALGEALRLIRNGDADVIIAGQCYFLLMHACMYV